MENAFLIVVIAVAVIGVAGAVVTLLLGHRTWEDYGSDGLLKDSDGLITGSGVPDRRHDAQRDDEIRQLLEARNARRARRGQPALDVEAELARLTEQATPSTPGAHIERELREEIRGLVLARNARRMRRGQPPLDIEAEIDRQIDELNL